MTHIEAMKQALEALENVKQYDQENLYGLDDEITTLRTAIAEAEKREPYGYFRYDIRLDAWVQSREDNRGVAFYTTPPTVPVQETSGCQHKRYSVDVHEQIGTCYDCGAEGRMRFVVGDATSPTAPVQDVSLIDEGKTAASVQEPDWSHPKIQALIGADARNRITIDLVWRILENPNGEYTASDMEYWDAIHDAVQAAAQRQWVGLSDVDLADCTTEEYETARYWERVLREKNAAAQPAYDQTALELCEVCGWKTLIPGDVCLNCEHEASARRQEPVAWCPDVCPITGLPFFMWIEHHETGQKVPTYGGPYDSYTIPVRDKDGSYCRERYDHDNGWWVTDEVEDVGVQIVSDQAYVSDDEPPASKPWVGLSTDEIYDMYNEPRSDAEMVEFARAIEQKLREKNGGAA